MPGTNVKTIERFIDRLNRAVSRSALLKVSIRPTGGRLLDISRLADVDRDAPGNILRAFVGRSKSASDPAGRANGETRRAATIDLDPLGGLVDSDEDDTTGDMFDGLDEGESPASPSRHEKMLTSIRRAAELAKRETGVHALWFGWPLLHVSTAEDDDAQSVLAPLFLFPASIEPHARRHSVMTVKRDDTIGPPRFNSELAGWLEQKLGISIVPPEEEAMAEWGLEQFVEWIEQSLKAFPSPPSIDCSGGLVRIPQSSKLQHSVVPRLLHAGALGLYRWQNASVLADLNAIKAMSGCPDPLDSFIAGRTMAEPKGGAPGEEERYLVTDADFSQAEVVWKARTAEGLVMHGPPGTGKSQTIVNVIADALARGEHVLMVCQKDAATRVVHNRLRQAGLEDLCLEVHDAENDRLSVFRAIRDQVDGLPDRARPQPRDRGRIASEIETLERDLDDFAIAMRQPDPAIGLCYRYLLALEGRALQRFPSARVLASLPKEIEMLGHEPAKSIGATLRRLGELFHAARVPWNAWTARASQVEHQTGFRRDAEAMLSAIRTAAEQLEAAVRALQQRDANGVLPRIEGDPTAWGERLGSIVDRCRELAERSPQDREAILGWLRSLAPRSAADGHAAMLASISEAMKAVEASDQCPRDPAWSATLANASREHVETALASCRRVVASTRESWLRRWLSRSLKRAKQVLQALRSDAVEALLLEVAQSGVRHAEGLEREAAVIEAAESCHPTLGRRFDDPAAAKALVRRVHATAAEAFSLHEELRHAPMLARMVEEILNGRPSSPADVALVEAHRRRADAVAACLPAINELAWAFSSDAIDGLIQEARSGGGVREWADRAIDDLDRIEALAAWEVELQTANPSWRPVIETLAAW